MDYLKFTKNDKTNFKLIDLQHKEFILKVNKLYNTILINNFIECGKQFVDLLEYLQFHFETEERLMKDTRYEGYYSHKLEHDRYLRKLNKIYFEIIQKNTLPTIEFFESIKNWFTNHLEMNDKKMGTYFVKKGIK